MSGWVVPQQTAEGLPSDVAVAGMGRRVGAWLLDGLIMGFGITLPVWVLSFVSGAISLNQRAIDQFDTYSTYSTYNTNPFSGMTEPIINVNMGLLMILMTVGVVLVACYMIFSWSLMAATPGQRMLGLKVLDRRTGKRLALGPSLIRWLILAGVSGIIGLLLSVQLLQTFSTIPARDWLGAGGIGGSSSATGTSNLVSWGSNIWSIVLLISAVRQIEKRGLHDLASGSIVVGRPSLAPPPVLYWGALATPPTQPFEPDGSQELRAWAPEGSYPPATQPPPPPPPSTPGNPPSDQ